MAHSLPASRNLLTIDATASAATALAQLEAEGAASLFVVQDGVLVGMIEASDLLDVQRVAPGELGVITAAELAAHRGPRVAWIAHVPERDAPLSARGAKRSVTSRSR